MEMGYCNKAQELHINSYIGMDRVVPLGSQPFSQALGQGYCPDLDTLSATLRLGYQCWVMAMGARGIKRLERSEGYAATEGLTGDELLSVDLHLGPILLSGACNELEELELVNVYPQRDNVRSDIAGWFLSSRAIKLRWISMQAVDIGDAFSAPGMAPRMFGLL